MKNTVFEFLKTYVWFVLIFIIQKPLFLVYYRLLYPMVTFNDYIQIMWYGLPLDLALAGYLSILPAVFIIISVWTHSPLPFYLRKIYYLFISIVLSVIFVVDMGLYRYWGFRLDSTPFFYFLSSPKDAVAGVEIWIVFVAIIAMIVCSFLIYTLFCLCLKKSRRKSEIFYRRVPTTGVMLLLLAALFIPIRGGFTVATLNTGKVYFSTNPRINHAAINPAFNLMESVFKQTDFQFQYRFMNQEQAAFLMNEL